jgi:hypothetical protein
MGDRRARQPLGISVVQPRSGEHYPHRPRGGGRTILTPHVATFRGGTRALGAARLRAVHGRRQRKAAARPILPGAAKRARTHLDGPLPYCVTLARTRAPLGAACPAACSRLGRPGPMQIYLRLIGACVLAKGDTAATVSRGGLLAVCEIRRPEIEHRRRREGARPHDRCALADLHNVAPRRSRPRGGRSMAATLEARVWPNRSGSRLWKMIARVAGGHTGLKRDQSLSVNFKSVVFEFTSVMSTVPCAPS